MPYSRHRLRVTLTNTDGAVTVEAALSLVTIVTFVTVLLGVLVHVACYIAAVDAAGAAARAAALGESYTVEKGTVELTTDAQTITAVVRMRTVFGHAEAYATVFKEPEGYLP